MVQTLNRRDRVRAATTTEIKQTARRILVSEGPDAVSLRAIAREMGMTAPALYRYFGSHEELIKYVIADIFTELTADLQAAIAAAGAASGGDLTAKVIAAAREFRRWSLNHQREFGMLFGTPLPGVNIEHDEITTECGGKFGNTFFAADPGAVAQAPVPGPRGRRDRPGAARAARALPRGTGRAGRRPAAGLAAHLPALLGAAVRDREPGGVRPSRLRARRRRADVRAHARGDRAAPRPGVPAAVLSARHPPRTLGTCGAGSGVAHRLTGRQAGIPALQGGVEVNDE